MRRAVSVALLLGACGSSGSDAKARCRDAIAKIDDTPVRDRMLVLAHACADAETGACRERLRHLEDVPVHERDGELQSKCGVDATRLYVAAGLTPPPSPTEPIELTAATLTLHPDGVDLAWNGMTLHLGKDCGAIGAALDTSHPASVKLVAESAIPYADVIAMMDCVQPHVPDIQLESQ